MQVVTLGDLVADLVVPIARLPIRPQEHQPARDIAIEAGGTGNFLVLAARLGMAVTALGPVGDDYYGAQVIKLLATEGVNVENVVIPPESRTTVSIVLIDDEAQHVFVGKYGTGRPLSFRAEWQELIAQTGAVFTTGYALHPTSAFSPELLLACLDIARENKVPIFFDIGPAAFHANRDHINTAIDRSTVLLATLEEISDWTGLADPVEAARRLQAQGPTLVVVKLGGHGCQLITAERQVNVAAFPVTVRDTAGAGDAFDAACVYGYLAGFSLEQIGALANAVGAMAVTKLGTGTRLPHRSEVVQLLQKHGHSFLDD
jgi:sugar/nucleoside kinase (ribokinase family)